MYKSTTNSKNLDDLIIGFPFNQSCRLRDFRVNLKNESVIGKFHARVALKDAFRFAEN